jgi:hypothetical protein
VLTSFHANAHKSSENWRNQFEAATVHIQWDPERTLHGKKLEYRSIQVGISRHLIREFTDEWILEISDCTPLVKKIRTLYLAGKQRRAKEQLPREKPYTIQSQEILKRLGMEQ